MSRKLKALRNEDNIKMCLHRHYMRLEVWTGGWHWLTILLNGWLLLT